jgi:hypothetical protein
MQNNKPTTLIDSRAIIKPADAEALQKYVPRVVKQYYLGSTGQAENSSGKLVFELNDIQLALFDDGLATLSGTLVVYKAQCFHDDEYEVVYVELTTATGASANVWCVFSITFDCRDTAKWYSAATRFDPRHFNDIGGAHILPSTGRIRWC